ncbi:DUF6868 family protein [Halioglobus pacificus]|uniref:DUF6868 domain-containing protein n=1 Tax=Parahalioglobus pacificus TaxID=930806 RepID=A0A918XCI2_9GAMM|nr:hypothetical protein [Halioglobus pacificus]GHD24908.1 hypothetical protein GCM10007053_00070 [Halioglobus pacificus]
MDSIQLATTFFGWCSVVNVGVYLLTALVLMFFREPVKKLHSKIAAVPSGQLDELYFSYLANFKIAILILNLTPYIALKLMA